MWRLAYSLATLRDQVNAYAPNRSKLSDGTIGDPAHAAVPSDHNENAAGVVCALDLTHDPAGGFDAHAIADILLVNRHPELKYLISNSRIAGAWSGWRWQPYYGINPHDKHIHVSVGIGEDGSSQPPYDSTQPWYIKGGEDMATDLQVDQWISYFHQLAYGKPPSDEVFNAWRPVLKNNFVDGSLSIMQGSDNNAGALKNQPIGDFDKVPFEVFKKKV